MRFIDILNKDRERIGLDTVVYTNKTIDEICYVDSDGKEFTYRDIFETANEVSNPYFKDNITGWVATNGVASHSEESLLVTGGGASSNVSTRSNDAIIIDTEYYLSAAVRSPSYALITQVNLWLGGNYLIDTWLLPDSQWKNIAGFKTAVASQASNVFIEINFGSTANATGATFYVDNAFAIDMLIFTTKPSESQMNIMRDIYITRRKITKETYTLREFIELNEPIISMNQMTLIDDLWEQSMSVDTQTDNYSDQLMNPYEKYFIKLSLDYEEPTNITFFHWYDGVNWMEFVFSPPEDFSYIKENLGYSRVAFGSTSSVVQKQYIKEILIINLKNFDEQMTESYMNYILLQYKKVKFNEENPVDNYAISGKSKNSVAYTNKTIDAIEYVAPSGTSFTLRDIFGDGGTFNFGGINNIIENGNLEIDTDSNGLSDNLVLYSSFLSHIILNEDNKQKFEGVADDDTDYMFIEPINPVTEDYSVGDICYSEFDSEFLANVKRVEFQFQFRRADSVTVGVTAINETVEGNHYATYVVPSDYATYRRLLFLAYVEGVATINVSFSKLKNYNLTKIFLSGDEPSALIFKTLLDKWNARKDLKKQLTYSDIFETANVFKNSFLNQGLDSSGRPIDWDNSSLGGQIYEQTEEGIYIEYGGTVGMGSTHEFEDDNKRYFYSVEVKNVYGDVWNAITYDIGGNYRPILITEEGIYSYIFENNDGYHFIYLRGVLGSKALWQNAFVFAIDGLFDERITQSTLDDLLAEFKVIKNTIITPEVFLITEPVGFGSRYKMKELNGRIYGHELDFENIGFKVNFGINYNAYEGFNLLQNHLKANEGIIEYDWGKGSRYADVRLVRAPKTEKDTLSLLRSKYDFKMLNPFYELISFTSNQSVKNTHEQDITPVIEFVTSSDLPSIEFENDDTSVVDIEIAFDFTGLSKPVTVIIDSENNTIKFADGTNAYDYVDKTKNSFVSLAYDIPYIIYWNSITSFKFNYKQWVVD